MRRPSVKRLEGSGSARLDNDLRCSEIAWDDVADCRHCAVRQQGLFGVLRGSDFDQILVPIKRAIVPAGTVLYLESGAADAVYTVRWGLVKLVKQAPEDSARIVRLLGPGAAVGLEALKEGIYWHAAITLRETGLCRIPFKVIDRLQSQNAHVAERLITQWETYVEYADRWITDLSAGPVKVRVCRLIGFLIEITHSTSGEIELPSVEDLAAILGASVESVSRATAELKRSKALIRVAPRTYRCNLEAAG